MAARRYVPSKTLTHRKPPEEDGAALHRWLGLGATAAATTRRVSRAEEDYSRARLDHGIPEA